PWSPSSAVSPWWTPRPAVWAGARTPGRPPATSRPRTWSGRSTGSAWSTVPTCRRWSRRARGWPTSWGGPHPRGSCGRSPGLQVTGDLGLRLEVLQDRGDRLVLPLLAQLVGQDVLDVLEGRD